MIPSTFRLRKKYVYIMHGDIHESHVSRFIQSPHFTRFENNGLDSRTCPRSLGITRESVRAGYPLGIKNLADTLASLRSAGDAIRDSPIKVEARWSGDNPAAQRQRYRVRVSRERISGDWTGRFVAQETEERLEAVEFEWRLVYTMGYTAL